MTYFAHIVHKPLTGPIAVFLQWATYVRDHPKRDWPDVLGIYPIPLWILEMEGRIARWEAQGREIAKRFDANQPGTRRPTG